MCSHARRFGIASSLLRQLHYHLHECHGTGSVRLHVRISIEAAIRLYCTKGYGVADIMPLYYGNGE
jgi:ribosomal protein S18 acetylase RimI-like enzyme